MHKPIQIKNLSLSFSHKTCFDDFTAQINEGARIAVIGRNGCGKSTLLKIMQGTIEPTSGNINVPKEVVFGYVPQVIEAFDSYSGGQRFNQSLTKALSLNPNVLLLDEPTNHLDQHNRKSLMRMLHAYSGTLIIVSHDTELLRNCIDMLWHIDQEKIAVFSGYYDDYQREIQIKRAAIEQKLSLLDRQKKDIHHALMKEQARASKSKVYGEKKYAGDKMALRSAQGQGENTHNKNKKMIAQTKEDLLKQLSTLRLPEIIVPKFSLSAAEMAERSVLSISEGAVGYPNQEPLIQAISLNLLSNDRIAIMGDNGSGKSTLIKAMLDDSSVIKMGNWYAPKRQDIGYLDQHYHTLSSDQTVLETIEKLQPLWTQVEIRRHLNDFLFHNNEEVNARVNQLSGGEKARLSLAQIAAKTPKLLILDEITNNLDLETCEHVVQVLRNYPGALIVISHDEDFLKEIEIKDFYQIVKGEVILQ